MKRSISMIVLACILLLVVIIGGLPGAINPPRTPIARTVIPEEPTYLVEEPSATPLVGWQTPLPGEPTEIYSTPTPLVGWQTPIPETLEP